MADKLTEMVERLRELLAKATPGPWCVETPMGETAPWIVQAGKDAYEWEPIATLGDCIEGDLPPRGKAAKLIATNADLIVEAVNALPDLLAALSRPNVDEMREALEPFARAADNYEAAPLPIAPPLPDNWTCSVRFGDLRRARAALRGSADNG